MPGQFNRYFVCFLDVLGFGSRFASLGLDGILEKYLQLVGIVDARNRHTEELYGTLNFKEGAYWSIEGEIVIFCRLYGAYGSDTILLFSHADFPENRYPDALTLTPAEREERSNDPAEGWRYHTVPCDSFLDLCNEVLCRGIEIGLPLRGAIAMGEAVLHLDRRVYLGAPLIEAAGLERPQKCIGASFSASFMQQTVPERYRIQHAEHFKGAPPAHFSGAVLDWPRHWRNTRTAPLAAAIDAFDTDHPRYSDYYTRTRGMIEASDAGRGLYTGPEHTRIRDVYPQFSTDGLELYVRAVRGGSPQPRQDTDPTS